MSVATHRLTRRFGPLVAVDGLELTLPTGGVIGLAGPNGSGKSTLIRMLLGLVRPSAGTAEVLGGSIGRPEGYAARVGALVEAPAFVPGLSARANLTSLARLRSLPAARVDEVLAVVGLDGRDREPVRQFSLGMKQRLGIASALLPDPELLLLDEPTNGLDPAGIVEMRELLTAIGGSGRTIVVSSHLLSEIESVCDHLVIVRFGVLLYAGPIGELLAGAGATILLRPEFDRDGPRLREVLVAAGWDASAAAPGRVSVAAGADAAAQLNRDAAAAGITLRGLDVSRASLESVFLELTGGAR
jgi:ABC-2 type transport system ATP-binding protein